ncbi:MAG: hypothetical protein ACQEW9_16815 [Bacteroidota bacterium]
MKKVLPIVLLLCFMSYHFGYYLFYFSQKYQLESSWQDKIYGVEINELEERLLEIPLSAPYMADQEDFQATNTRFEKEGKYYRAIKQRYQSDTLQVIYVPDTARKTLESTVLKWISVLTDQEFPVEGQNSNQLKVFVKDYLQLEFLDFQTLTISSNLKHQGFTFSAYMSPYFQLESPPPQIS